MNHIPIFRPSGTDKEVEALARVIKSGYWSSGPEARAFEEEFAKVVLGEPRHCITLNSCTAALHLAGKTLGLPKGSEVLIPAITFVSSAYFALYNDLKPVFVDVEEDTLNISLDDLRRKIGSNTKAILVMHYGGHACDMDGIMRCARTMNIPIIEDCAHGLGATYKGKHVGTFGEVACFSFQAVKNASTGDGGMLVTHEDLIAKRVRSLRWIGMDRDTRLRHAADGYHWDHDVIEVGYKCQMCDV